jgi:hypothetical protein
MKRKQTTPSMALLMSTRGGRGLEQALLCEERRCLCGNPAAPASEVCTDCFTRKVAGSGQPALAKRSHLKAEGVFLLPGSQVRLELKSLRPHSSGMVLLANGEEVKRGSQRECRDHLRELGAQPA